jgi:hypothetical protein
MRPVYAAWPLVVCLSAAAQADPTVYKGTIGTHAIVVEFSEDIAKANGPVAGRYFYPAQGVDIPLNPVSSGSGKAELAEEKPCKPEICKEPEGDAEPKPPVGARWTLTPAPKGTGLEGTWQAADGPVLPIKIAAHRRPPGRRRVGGNIERRGFCQDPRRPGADHRHPRQLP